MIHVAVDANCLAWGWGGIPKVVDRVVRELVRRDDVRVDLLANASQPFTDIDGVHEAFRRIRGTALWRETYVSSWVARTRPTVFWAPESILPRRLAVPSVVTLHDLAALLLPGVKPARHRLAFRTAVRRSARSATRVVAVSRTTADDAERLFGLPLGSVHTVPNGVDDAFRPGSREDARALVRERLGVEGPFFLAVGSLEPRKGLDVLIAAAAVARARGASWRLVLAGTTGFKGEEIAARARASAACTLLGAVDADELLALYRSAEALAAPSLYEGFGLTPLEALACGTPAVVAGGSGGLVETVGEAAIVVAERDPESWADALERAAAERERRAPAGLRHADRFRWPAVAEQLLDVFAGAAAGRR